MPGDSTKWPSEGILVHRWGKWCLIPGDAILTKNVERLAMLAMSLSFDPLEAHPQPQVEEGAWREICFPGAFFSGMVGRIAKLQQQCNNLSLLR